MTVIYLTGAPATGKTTLARNLVRRFPSLLWLSYSTMLRKHVARRMGLTELSADKIRAQSSEVVMSEDIAAVDDELLASVRVERLQRHLLIDSHAVTKETYGFRVTAFKPEKLKELAPDIVVCLYANAATINERISLDADGRSRSSQFGADMHTSLQTGLAVQYGFLLGVPVYIVDSSISESELADIIVRRAKLA